MADFEGKKSSNDIKNNGTIIDDEVVSSYVPPRYVFWCWVCHDAVSAVCLVVVLTAQRKFFVCLTIWEPKKDGTDVDVVVTNVDVVWASVIALTISASGHFLGTLH